MSVEGPTNSLGHIETVPQLRMEKEEARTFQDARVIYHYFSRQIQFSRTFQECPQYSSIF